MDANQAAEILSREVAQLRDRAVVSTDPNVVAKAIAVSDPEVQALIISKLTAGKELTRVTTIGDPEPGRNRVFFEIKSAGAAINLNPSGFLVHVDVNGARVSSVTDPFEGSEQEAAGALPFVLDVPSAASSIMIDPQEAEAANAATGNFFSAMNMQHFSISSPPPVVQPVPSSTATIIATIWPTLTFSGGKIDDQKGDVFRDRRDKLTVE
jgi:hypothetical protein